MSDEALGILAKAVSTPNWVEKLMLVVTTLYLIATICVFITNRRMAQAAVRASDISLLDKRFDILKKIKNISWGNGSNTDEVRYIENWFDILFPKYTTKHFLKFILIIEEHKTKSDDYYNHMGMLDNLVRQSIVRSGYASFAALILNYKQIVNQEELNEANKIIAEAQTECRESNCDEWRDPLVMHNELEQSKKRLESEQNKLIELIEQYLRKSIDTDSYSS
ncbi:MAG: hypothetical protein ABFC56_16645 [Clostridiaceae bacterium]